jgi:hypothetical protein
MVAAAAFAAAGVMAYMQYNAEQAALTACSGALSAAGGACAAAFAATCSGGGTCMYPLKSGGMQATSTIAPITNQAIMSLTPAMSAAKQAADKALEQGNRASYTAACSQCSGACGAASACEPMFALNFSTKGYCPAPLSLTDNSAIGNILYAHNFTPINSQVGQEKGMANFLQSLLLNDANADLFTPMGIASSAAISYILATSKTIGMQIDMFLFSPFNRVITWAGIGLTIALATKATDNQIAIIKNNISKIDQILNAMYAYKNGTPASNAATVTPSVTNPTTGQTTVQNNSLNLNNAAVSDIDLKAKGATALPCITGNDPKKCASFSGQLNAQNDIKLMPPFVQQQISMIGKVTDGINGTSKITASTLSDAKTLANANNALRTELAKQQKSLQDKLKASGNKTDIAASSAKFSDDLRAIMQKELDKNKSTAGAILASFGGGTAGNIGNNGATNSNTTASDTSKTPESNSLKNAINANADLGLDNGVLGAASNASGSKLKDEESEDAAALKANGLNSKAAGLKNSLDDFDLKNDISKDKDTSLFQLISNRYQKSGYDRLFKRVK